MSDFAKTIREYLSDIPEYEIQIGVFSEKSKRKKTYNVGITNAEIMFIQENGSPLKHIPSRPILKMTIAYGNTILKDTLANALNAYLKNGLDGLEFELNKLCIKMENYAREVIYSNDGRLTPNAPSTIKSKGYNHPLFNTGQLARSITCKLVKV